MKVWISPYKFAFKTVANAQVKSNERQGFLIQLAVSDTIFGYADCHPWPEFGDKAMQTQLNLLKSGQLSSLLERSLQWAQKDGRARQENQPLFYEPLLGPSHCLVQDLSQAKASESFGVYKIKLGYGLGRNLRDETKRLQEFCKNNSVKLRLDFNCSLSAGDFYQWIDDNKNIIPQIDFIEDPFPYDAQAWAETQKKWNLSLALDFAAHPLKHNEGFNFVIVKPARQDIEALVRKYKDTKKRFIITHSMDHPIGQLTACYWAQQLLKTQPCLVYGLGLLPSSQMAKSNVIWPSLQTKGSYIQLPYKESGFGWKDYLDTLPWSLWTEI